MGLNNLQQVNGFLTISTCNQLNDITALSSLQAVEDNLEVIYCDQIQ